MRCIILRIFSSSGGIVVLNQILKDTGEEIVVLRKRLFKREVYQFIHQCTSEWGTLCCIGHKWSQRLKQRYFCVGCGLCGKYIRILFRYIGHSRIEDGIKIPLPLLIPKIGYQVVRFKHRNIRRNGTLNKHTFIIRKILVCCLPFYISRQFLGNLTLRIF